MSQTAADATNIDGLPVTVQLPPISPETAECIQAHCWLWNWTTERGVSVWTESADYGDVPSEVNHITVQTKQERRIERRLNRGGS